MKYPQLPGMECVSTCKYYYITYYIRHNRRTPCNHLHGPCSPLPTPRLCLPGRAVAPEPVLSLPRPVEHHREGSLTKDPVHRAWNTQIPTSMQQNNHSPQAKYFR